MMQKPVRKGSKQAKERMAKVRASIGKKKPKRKGKKTVSFKTKSGKTVNFNSRR